MKYEEIKKLMDDMGDSKIDNLDIEFPDGIKISMSKNKNNGVTVLKTNEEVVELPAVGATLPVSTNAGTPLVQEPAPMIKVEDESKTINSPMVGTFYSSSSPDKSPFVKVGDQVKKGDTLCIIEAMKLMNEIEAEHDGEIVEIFVRNEDMVEYGMPLFRLK